jgi:hypothetical protein
MRSRRTYTILAFLCASLFATPAPAQVYNLHLVTDNVPDYTDLQSLVESSTGAWRTPQDKCIAVWRWGRRSRRQTSCAQESKRHIIDPILHFNSYGTMNCGVISALNIPSWLLLGYGARYIQLGDHTVSQVSWDEGETWHLFDSSMSIFCFNHAGQVASCEEIMEAHACELSGGKSEPGHYYFYHGAPQCVSGIGPDAWRCAADNPVDYDRTLGNGAASYTDGFSVDEGCQQVRYGRRWVLNIRPGESYTRYWEPLDGARGAGQPDPDFFRPMANGSDPDAQHRLGNIRGNGEWIFRPPLSSEDRDAVLYDASGLAPPDGGAGLRPAEAGRPAWAVFAITAANAITSMRIEADGRRAEAGDVLRVLVSRTAGIRWQPVWTAETTGAVPIRLKLRDEVAGGTQAWIKIEMAAAKDPRGAGIDALKVVTFTQLNRRALPALTLGSNQVLLRADEQAETVELWPPLHDDLYKETAFEAQDLFSDSLPDGAYKATLGTGADKRPCSVVWRVEVPTDIVDVDYAVVATVRGREQYVSLQHSWDGSRYDEFHRHRESGFPMDRRIERIFREGEVPAGARLAFLRGVFFSNSGAGTYNMAGIQDVSIRVHHRPRRIVSKALEVTYEWIEHRETGDVTRSHAELVKGPPHRYAINVAGRRDPTMVRVTVNLRGSPPDGAPSRRGYSDGIDVGPGFERAKVAYHWGSALSAGMPYAASRTSSASSGNPDTDGLELTNGIVIAPTAQVSMKGIQSATAFWEPGEAVTITVDLGSPQAIGGARATTHQPNERYCHPKTIEVSASADGREWRALGAIRHDDLWKPPGDYEPWEHDDAHLYEKLPAGGRLAYSFPLAFAGPVTARYVRFACTPLGGRGMGISELQVFDRVAVEPWPAEIRLPDGK